MIGRQPRFCSKCYTVAGERANFDYLRLFSISVQPISPAGLKSLITES